MRAAALLGMFATAGAIVLGFTILGGSGSNARAGQAALRIARDAPLTVRGLHFHSGERVRVSAAGKSAPAKAKEDGTFIVTIRGATRCDTLRIVARGSAGSYVIVRLPPQPACLPARTG